tara:strand:- start:316 stop:957 length:642 start_codon:yes stop_codon:yes gene_type:complete
MPHLQFPTTYVYWENLKDHDELKRKYMPIIDKIEQDNPNEVKNPFDACTVKCMSITSGPKINNFLEPSDMTKIIWNPLDNFIKEINSKYQYKISVKESFVSGYWFNTYDKYDNQDLHCHIEHKRIKNGVIYHAIFSGVYILNDENESSSLLFRSSREQPFTDPTIEYTFDTGKTSDIKEGTVMIFPVQLLHMVRNCIKPGRRTIAFNIFSSLL